MKRARIDAFIRFSPFFAVFLVALLAGFVHPLTVKAMPPSEVQITDVVEGSGDVAELGARVTVHYTGWLMDGTQFDSSRTSDTPFQFTIGAREVIRGWDIGVQGMRVGGKRELIIPSDLAYGKRGYPGAIPPDAVLKFEIELLELNQNKVTHIDIEELQALIARGVPVIDLRRPNEWAATGVIEGAHLITAFHDVTGFSKTFIKELKAVVEKTDEFIMIDKDARRSTYLSGVFADRKGYTSIYNAKGGMEAWVAAGLPVVQP